MRITFAYFKKIIVTAGFVLVAASVLTEMTAPSGTRDEQTASISVDRTSKRDRLPYASRSKAHVNSSLLTTTPQPPSQQRPLGCDSAFSSLADPTHAHIYKRCMA
jgi:hypothetical protein